MGPTPPRRRWSPKPHEEVQSSIRQFALPLVGARARRVPLAKLPALQAPTRPTNIGRNAQSKAEHEVDQKVVVRISCWLKGGSAAASRLLASYRILSQQKQDAEFQMRKPKLAFELLSLLAFEFTDFEDAGTTNEPDCRKSRTWLLTSLLRHIEASLYAADKDVDTALKTAGHYAAIFENSIGTQRDGPQVVEDLATVTRWQLEEEVPRRLSAQAMWSRRRGLKASEGPTALAEGGKVAPDLPVDTLPMYTVSNIQRWHCAQLVNQIRWSNQIVFTLDAQSSAAYNMLGLAQELTAGFVVGWAFAFWRLQYKEGVMAAEQIQKVERSSRINREYVGVFFVHWCLLTSRTLWGRTREEIKIKKLHLRLLSVRLKDVEAKKTKSQQDTAYDKTAHYLIVRKMQAAQEDKSRLDFRLQTMPPIAARESLHLVAELFMGFLADFSMLQHVPCRHKLLGKDLIFLANDPAESHQDITALPSEEILVRWVNCILAEARHSASVLLTDAMDDEDGRSNWQAADSSRYGFRCREVRAIATVQMKSLEHFLQDGKILTILYAMFKAYRRNKTTFDPADLAVLDEKDPDRRAAAAQNAFVSLSPLLISRFLLNPLDVVSGQHLALKTALSATLLREAAGNLQMQDLSWTLKKQGAAAGTHLAAEPSQPRPQGQNEAQYTMATVMDMFENIAGMAAQPRFVDLSRLCFRWEPLTALQDMGITEILCRWVNLQVYGVLTPAEGVGVKNLGTDLASGQVLLRLIAAVAPAVIELEKVAEQVTAFTTRPGQAKERDVIRMVLLLTKRCVPFCILGEEVFLSCHEAALSTLVAALFLCWPNLRVLPDSPFGKMLRDMEEFVQAGLRVASMPRELVPEDKLEHLRGYCEKSDLEDGKRLKELVAAIEEQHRLRLSLQRRLQNFLSEVQIRRVQARMKVKGFGGGQIMLGLQELVRDEDWILLTETEHPATRSSRVRAVVRENLVLIANLMEFFSICGPNGMRQVCWSGIAQLYRDAHMYCPCLFLSVEAAQEIFQEVLRAEPEADSQVIDPDASSSISFLPDISSSNQGRHSKAKDLSWLQFGISVSGFIRFLLRVCVHREEGARSFGAFAVPLTRSLKELVGSHLQRVLLDPCDEFTNSSHIQEVQHLQEEWQPFLGKVFAVYAEHGVTAPQPEVQLQMGEDSLVCLFSDAALLGAALSSDTARSLYHKLLSRRHFQPVHANCCFRGQAEVRRRRRGQKQKRNASLPPQLKGPAPSFTHLRVPPSEKAEALYFQDFQELCLLAAMYRNPNMVVPLHQRYQQFLAEMLEGLQNRVQPSGISEPSLEQLAVEASGVEEWDEKKRSFKELQDALEASDGAPDAAWSQEARKGQARSRSERSRPLPSGSDDEDAPATSRRTSSAPPTTSLPSKFQKALQMAFGTESRMTALSAIKIAAGSLEGLGMPNGSKLSSVASLLRASKRLGLHLDAADVNKRRSEVGREAMHRRRSSAMIKVKFMTDRHSEVANRASLLNSLLPSASGSMQPSRSASQNASRAGSFSQETPCA